MGDDDLHYVSSCGEACHSNLLFTFQQFFSSLLFQISHFISSISITHSISINVETHLKIRRELTLTNKRNVSFDFTKSFRHNNNKDDEVNLRILP